MKKYVFSNADDTLHPMPGRDDGSIVLCLERLRDLLRRLGRRRPWRVAAGEAGESAWSTRRGGGADLFGLQAGNCLEASDGTSRRRQSATG